MVQSGEEAFAALSAEMLLPPVVAVIDTEPKALPGSSAMADSTRSQQSKIGRVVGSTGCA